MKTLNIIGCGVVGKVLGRLFHASALFEIRDILNRSVDSAHEAASFIGTGQPVSDYAGMHPADLYLIAASDDAIAGCADALAASGLLRPESIVFHLSGSLPSLVLAPVRERGGQIASVHPVKSFTDPSASVATFAGTWCGIEGDAPAVELLSAAFRAVGGRLFTVDPAFKTLYHVGSVLVCNYLTSLIEVGVKAYGKGGLPRETALQVMEPLVRGTLDNIFRVGTAQALTGPIARGDAAVVARQLDALEAWDSEVALVYRSLGRVALDLARQRGGVADENLDSVKKLLAEKDK